MQDVVGLARALCAVLIDDPLRKHLQVAARATALRFTPQAIVDRYARVFASVHMSPHWTIGDIGELPCMWKLLLLYPSIRWAASRPWA